MSDERLNLMAPEVRTNPYPFYAELRRAPVCQVDPGGLWAVSRYDDAMTVLKNPQLFSSEGFRVAMQQPWLDHNPICDSILLMDPPKHGQLRALLGRAFGSGVLTRMEPRIRAFAEQLVSGLVGRGPVDFVQAFTLPLPALVIGELMGLDVSLTPHLKRWADDLVHISAAPQDPVRQEQIRTTIREMRHYFLQVLEARRENPTQDLVGELLQAQVDGVSLTQEELLGFLFLLLTAGLETTVHLLGHMAKVLADHPEVWERLRADVSLVPRFVEEVLRYDPPVHAVMRLATDDVTLGGVHLPRYSPVLVLLGSVNHDTSRFPGADRFDLDRPGPQNMSFGHGIHFCLGAPLARLEARVALEVWLARVGRLERGPTPISWTPALTVRGPVSLPLELRPR
jgi:cytochrome P450